MENQIPSEFWRDNVSKSHGKHNIDHKIWEMICKFRNSPIKLVEDCILGEYHKLHEVIPKDCKGYLIDYPEVFHLSDEDLEQMEENNSFASEHQLLPACFPGLCHVVFLSDYQYEIIDPFFDMGLADYGCENVIN